MNLQIPSAYQRPLAIGLPLLGLLIALLLVVPRYRALAADRNELVRTQELVRAKRSFISDAAGQNRGPVVAQLPADRNEPVQFLRQLSDVAAQCGVKLTNVTAAAAEENAGTLPPVAGAQKEPDAARSGLPAGTTPVALQISVEGTYPALAVFFSRLENYPRLISVTNVSMNATQYPKITAQFRLTRYIGSLPDASLPG